MRQVLFVDDESNVLDGLKRMLRPMRHEWEMRFTDDPGEALEILEREPAHAIVTDMRMPQMSGADLLERARELRPGMARIVLSGHAEHKAAIRAVGVAHQFLPKPCDAETLKRAVSRVCEIRDLLPRDDVAAAICRVGALPSLPDLYRAISEETRREEASLKRVAAIVELDISMSAKVLQLANSAFFGLSRRVTSIEQAVNALGIDVMRALVVSNAAFASFETRELEFFDRLWRHSWLAGSLARRIALGASDDPVVHAQSLQAGMLHDIGQLVLAAAFPEEYGDVVRSCGRAGARLVERETDLLACDHGRAGAYLIGLWGLPQPIIDALAYYHRPLERAGGGFTPLTAAHAASALLHEHADEAELGAGIDTAYLAAVGCAHRLDQWREETETLVAGQDEEEDRARSLGGVRP